MAEELITNEKLYEILRKEKTKSELQEIDPEFFNLVKSYIKEKRSITQAQKEKISVFSKFDIENTKKQLETTKKLLTELFEKRQQKIIQLASICSRTNPENNDIDTNIPSEKLLFSKIFEILTEDRISNLLILTDPDQISKKTKDINITSEEQKNKLLRITNPIPRFVGLDQEIYGPYDEEEVANLPQDIARVLISNKRAEEIKEDETS